MFRSAHHQPLTPVVIICSVMCPILCRSLDPIAHNQQAEDSSWDYTSNRKGLGPHHRKQILDRNEGAGCLRGNTLGKEVGMGKGRSHTAQSPQKLSPSPRALWTGLTLESCVSEGGGPSLPTTDQSLGADSPWEVGRDLRQGQLSSAEGNFQKELPAS